VREERDKAESNIANLIDERLSLKNDLAKLQNGDSGRALATNLKKIIGEYESNYKPTSRDWTKARQLLNELKKIID